MSNGGVTGAIAGAAVARRRREILEEFRRAGATAPERAVAESSVKSSRHALFGLMVKRGVVVRTPNGRVYLDEAAEARAGAMRRRVALAAVLVALAGLLVLFLVVKGTP